MGLRGFANNVAAAGGSVTQLSWAPPAGAQADLGRTLAGLVGHPAVEAANARAYARYLAAQPRLVDLALAREALPGLADGQRRILHSGPPISWHDMCGPQRGAITGAILCEGWADSLESAERLAGVTTTAPMPCLTEAIAALAATVGGQRGGAS